MRLKSYLAARNVAEPISGTGLSLGPLFNKLCNLCFWFLAAVKEESQRRILIRLKALFANQVSSCSSSAQQRDVVPPEQRERIRMT